ncbi:MAG: methyltransferase domain-containing protein [bacterium]
MSTAVKMPWELSSVEILLQSEDAFTRQDESDDALFYEQDRFVSHLDTTALTTVEKIIGGLVTEQEPVILDLMAGWDSHLPEHLAPCHVAGLGLNRNELSQNPDLDEYIIHDLNKDASLPFKDNTFDAVLNTVSVDYLTRPVQLFKEVKRVLKPGGLFLVIFSNRFFPPKAIKVWQEASENERVDLVKEFFLQAGFEQPELEVSMGRPRPENDKYSHLGVPSDPVYAVFAEKEGGAGAKKRKESLQAVMDKGYDIEEVEARKSQIKHTLCCPYCGEKLAKWEVPEDPFVEWPDEYLYICFNDFCPYLVEGWRAMYEQGMPGMSCRLMYVPKKDNTVAVPVQGLNDLREGIKQ